MPHWAQDAFFYHVYPLGQFGAESRNDFCSPPNSRLDQLREWFDHLRWVGANALYLGPVFESTAHGYDTADYYHVDRRLGADETLAALTAAARTVGIRVILDVASTLRNPAHLYPLYLLLFTMPGVPSIYAGSEWGMEGVKAQGDDRPLRPALPSPTEAASRGSHPHLAQALARFATVRRNSVALRRGRYRQLHISSEHFAFERKDLGDHAIVAINAAAAPVRLDIPCAPHDSYTFEDQLEPGMIFSRQRDRLRVELPPCWGRVLVPS